MELCAGQAPASHYVPLLPTPTSSAGSAVLAHPPVLHSPAAQAPPQPQRWPVGHPRLSWQEGQQTQQGPCPVPPLTAGLWPCSREPQHKWTSIPHLRCPLAPGPTHTVSPIPRPIGLFLQGHSSGEAMGRGCHRASGKRLGPPGARCPHRAPTYWASEGQEELEEGILTEAGVAGHQVDEARQCSPSGLNELPVG